MDKRCLLTILLGGCAAVGAFAQQHATGKDKEMTVDLNPVVVTGTGTHQRLKNTPAPVEVVTANEIKKARLSAGNDHARSFPFILYQLNGFLPDDERPLQQICTHLD